MVIPTVPVLQINAELKSLIVSILNSLCSRKGYYLPLSPSPSQIELIQYFVHCVAKLERIETVEVI